MFTASDSKCHPCYFASDVLGALRRKKPEVWKVFGQWAIHQGCDTIWETQGPRIPHTCKGKINHTTGRWACYDHQVECCMYIDEDNCQRIDPDSFVEMTHYGAYAYDRHMGINSYGKEGKDRAGGAGVVYPTFAPPHRMWWRHPDHHMPPACYSTHENKNEKRWLAYTQKMDQLSHYQDMKQDISCGRHVTCEKVPAFRCAHCGLTDHKWCNCPYYHPNRKIDCDEERQRQLRRQRTCQDFCVHCGNFRHGILTCEYYQCLESAFCEVRHLPYRSPEIHTQELPGY